MNVYTYNIPAIILVQKHCSTFYNIYISQDRLKSILIELIELASLIKLSSLSKPVLKKQ